MGRLCRSSCRRRGRSSGDRRGGAHCYALLAQPFVDCIRVLRAERRWSQGDLAERIGVSRQTVNEIENGRYDPSLPLAFRISEVFGRPIEQIFEREHGGSAPG